MWIVTTPYLSGGQTSAYKRIIGRSLKHRLMSPESQSFWFRRSEVRPQICFSNKFLGDTDAAVPGTTPQEPRPIPYGHCKD